jgi:hypothetical protein
MHRVAPCQGCHERGRQPRRPQSGLLADYIYLMKTDDYIYLMKTFIAIMP